MLLLFWAALVAACGEPNDQLHDAATELPALRAPRDAVETATPGVCGSKQLARVPNWGSHRRQIRVAVERRVEPGQVLGA